MNQHVIHRKSIHLTIARTENQKVKAQNSPSHRWWSLDGFKVKFLHFPSKGYSEEYALEQITDAHNEAGRQPSRRIVFMRIEQGERRMIENKV